MQNESSSQRAVRGEAPVVRAVAQTAVDPGGGWTSAPRLNRSCMAPHGWDRSSAAPSPGKRWHMVGTLRRTALVTVVGIQTYLATNLMVSVLPYHGNRGLEIAVLVLFAILCFWISSGFWMAVLGFVQLLSGRDRYAISSTIAGDEPIDPQARTAILMPVRNEHVPRVFAGLKATHDSLAVAGQLERFDFFVLSDSDDADTRIAELAAWRELCQEVQGFGRIFYRWRRHRIKRKSGNIADFCRRWGRNYRYMVILDADSVMSGECLTTLVRLMEANPNAGIVQTAPLATGRHSLFARIQQFANRVYGPIFVAGLHYFELGEAHYWGHNAIIRVAPFIEHCALARLRGRGALSGEILSHDFVEAALMRRAGWAVWIAYDLPGSHEEMPPNLIDELSRDRRWCQGNLINFRLTWARGLHPSHRAVFLTGAMAYLSAGLWFLFLILSTALLAVHTLIEPAYFVAPEQLFPLWPEWHPERGINLYVAVAGLLFLPKVLGVLLILIQGARGFGGRLRLSMSALLELVFSALLAPIRMLFHTQFVLAAVTGWKLHWKSPARQDDETGWGRAFRHHGLHTLLGLGWAGLVYWLNPAFLWWLLPVVGALIVSIPLSVWSSRGSRGRRLGAAGLCVIPQESNPPNELRLLHRNLREAPAAADFLDALVDPAVNALARAAIGRPRPPAGGEAERRELITHVLVNGPEGLDSRQRAALLRDGAALQELHVRIGSAADQDSPWSELLTAHRKAAGAPGRASPEAMPAGGIAGALGARHSSELLARAAQEKRA